MSRPMDIPPRSEQTALVTRPPWHRPLAYLANAMFVAIGLWAVVTVQRTAGDVFLELFGKSDPERVRFAQLHALAAQAADAGADGSAARRLGDIAGAMRPADLCLGPRRAAMEQAVGEFRKEAAGFPAQAAAAAPPARAMLASALHARIAQVESVFNDCLRDRVVEVQAARRSLFTKVYVMVGLLALAVGAVLFLRRRDRRALTQQLRFSQQLIDAVPLPLSFRSAGGEFLLVNRAFEDKHRVSRDTVVGRPAREALSHAAAQRIASMDRRALAVDGPVEEIFLIDDDMGTRHVQVRVQALRQDDAGLAGVIGVQTDVTALRLKEAELLRANDLLSQLSARMLRAQEDERQRLARDLHDQVGQILTALKLQLASLARRTGIEQPQAALVAPLDLAEEALRHTRDLSASLHPHMLGDLGLQAAVGSLIERFIRPSLQAVDLRCDLEPARGPQACELVAYRVVQEALTNVIRHAKATRAGVMLETQGGTLVLEVIDDGVGFAAGEGELDLQRVASVGLAGMRDRVRDLGGSLQVESRPGVGTSVRARLPWGQRSEPPGS